MKTKYKTSLEEREKSRKRMRALRRSRGVPERKSIEERLWGNSEPVTESGCWIYMRHRRRGDHGQIGFRNKVEYAHRVAWMLTYGDIPKGMCICHKCDVSCCVNPNHLFLGTQSDNTKDRDKKGRTRKGEDHPVSKLTERQVVEIRNDRRSYANICADYGITLGTLSPLKNRKTWKHVPELTVEEFDSLKTGETHET